MTTLRWTSADLEALPDDGKRYEIIDGELYVSKQPHWHHQMVSGRIFAVLDHWTVAHDAGQASLAPGVIFDDDDDVAPDVVWASKERLAAGLAADGKLYAAPELAVEILSPGMRNEQRDRDAKLKLYSRRGVAEYWIVDWRTKSVVVYRREDAVLKQVATLYSEDALTSPLLPEFRAPLDRIFAGVV